MGFWGATAICVWAGYHPPRRHSAYKSLSLLQKIKALDPLGVGLFTAGLTLFLVGLNLGAGGSSWTDAKVLSTMVIGLVSLLGFGIYEWKGTRTGIAHHDLFLPGKNAGKTFAIYLVLMFIEGIMLFAFVIFYPVM